MLSVSQTENALRVLSDREGGGGLDQLEHSIPRHRNPRPQTSNAAANSWRNEEANNSGGAGDAGQKFSICSGVS